MSSITSLIFIVLLISFAVVVVQCDHGSTIVSDDLEARAVEIISPDRIKSGDYLPLVVQALSNGVEINTNITERLHLMSDNAFLEKPFIGLKKGIGCLTTKIESNESFKISAGNTIGERSVRLVNIIPVKSYSGTIETTNEIWDSTFDRHITGDLTISLGTKLIIEEGARIILNPGVNFFVQGTIQAEGSKGRPIQFISDTWDSPWGGIEIHCTHGTFEYCFFVNGGGDESRTFGHSHSQAVLTSEYSDVSLTYCYFFDNVGKAIGARESKMNLDRCLISRCDTGGEFKRSLMSISHSYVTDIPNDDGIFADDDNDGFYFSNVYSGSEEPSRVENCFIITGKDDAIDHNGAKLKINNCWLEGFMHEGVAGSNANWVEVFGTVVKNCEQGIEAGYGNPTVYVDHCVVVDNDIGLRFGDSYDSGCYGKMFVTNTILLNNGDNIYNFDLNIQAPVDSGIVISYSMTNDPEYNHYPFCITGIPEFDSNYYLLPDSPGKAIARDGSDLGLIKDH